MGVMRSVLAGVLVVLLVGNLVAANVAVGADRTALNADFVKTTLEEEHAYRAAQAIVVDRVRERIETVGIPIPPSMDLDEAVRDVLTRRYLENQTEKNVDRVYGYLHGRRDDLVVAIRTTPVTENLADLVESRIRNMSVSEMVDYVTTRENMTVSVAGITLDLAVVGKMAKNRSAYRNARQALRAEIRQTVEETLPAGASERQIEAAVNRTLRTLATRLESQIRSIVRRSVNEPFQPVADAAADMVMVGVRGLTRDMRYATFERRLSRAKADLAENASAVVETRLDAQLKDRMTLADELDPDVRDRIRLAKRAVGVIDLLVYALPLLAVVLVGALYLLTRSIAATAAGSGIALAIAGGSGYLVARLAPRLVRSRVGLSSLPREAVNVALGALDQVAGAFGAQSLFLLVLGVVLLAAAVVLRFGGGSTLQRT